MKKIIIAIVLATPLFSTAQVADSSKRLVPVKGALNFRDIGGYTTKDGKEVVWGKVYRSAAINKLSDADVALLDQRGIHTVVDFRGKSESAAAPDRLPPHTDYTLSPAGSDSLPDMTRIAALLKQGDFLENFYGKEGLKYFGDRYRPLFIKLLTVDTAEAVMYHCTGGRDRTGMATALLLYILNVPQATIEADFVASNVYLAPSNKAMMQPLAQLSGMTEEEVTKQMALRPELIHIFFKSIMEQYGSIEQFLQQEMAIGPKEIGLLRARLTI